MIWDIKKKMNQRSQKMNKRTQNKWRTRDYKLRDLRKKQVKQGSLYGLVKSLD